MPSSAKLQPTTDQRNTRDISVLLSFEALAEFGDVEGVEVDASIISPNNPWRNAIHVAPFDDRFKPGRTYDTILMLDVLEHLSDPEMALRHALDLLAPGGKLVITVPAFRMLWTSHDDLNHHFTRYTRGSLRSLTNGLARIQQDRYLFHWLFLAKLLVRAKESLIRTRPRPPRIPPRWLNESFYRLTNFEQRWLRWLKLPIGGSYLAVVEPLTRPLKNRRPIIANLAIPVTASQFSTAWTC